MSWEQAMAAVLEDLEQQAAGLHLVERDLEVAEIAAAEYARVGLAARLHASIGRHVRVRLVGGHQFSGRLARTGEDWLLLVDGAGEWIVHREGIVSIAGVSSRADSEETWSAADRLSLRAVLRRLAADSAGCVVHLSDHQQLQGRLGRVGKDFVELHTGEGGARTVQVVPLGSAVAWREQA